MNDNIIYGATDSFFIISERGGEEEVRQEMNDLVKSYGDKFELEVDKILDKLIILPGEDGRALRNNYIMIKNGEVKPKGSLLKPHSYPRFFKINPSKYLSSIIAGGVDSIDLSGEDLDMLFMEEGIGGDELFHSNSGEDLKVIDKSRVRALSSLMLENSEVTLTRSSVGSKIISSLFVPMSDHESTSLGDYLLYNNGGVSRVTFQVQVRRSGESISEIILRRSMISDVDRGMLENAVKRYLKNHPGIQAIERLRRSVPITAFF